MKRINVLLTLLTVLCSAQAFARVYSASPAPRKHNTQRTTLASLAEDDYDVKYLRFNIQVSDTSVYVAGNVATTAQVTAPTMAAYVFELDSTLSIDSATVNSINRTVTRSGSLCTISLPAAFTSGALFTAQIYYHGLPPGGGGGFFNGITHSVSSAGTHMVFTVSDPYVAKNWWPCKQSIPDKIDSVDMFVTVPRGVADGSCGVLVNVDTSTTAGFWTYHWKTNYKIDYYLISIAVAKYAQYKSYWHFTGSSDSVLIHNFFIDTTTFNPAYKARFDSLGMIMDYYSGLFGRYPFWKEKYGVCYTSLPGGMEHQTMTTIGNPSTSVIAHELCHQWFGDNVTYKTWGDMWLSEGFATFSEQLFLAHFWSAAAGKAQRQAYQSLALSRPCGKLYVDDTTTSDSLFDGATVYAKGAAVVRMLQYAAPSDSIFFSVLRQFQANYAYGHAATADLKTLAESQYGYNLDTFFNQWIYGRGYPSYKISWNQQGSTVYVKLIQSTSCPSATRHFSNYVQLQLHGTTADTVVKVYNASDTQVYVFNWAPAMSSVQLNPDIWTLCRLNGVVVKDATLRLGAVRPAEYKVYPNPTRNNWQIENLEEGTALELTDINGRTVWTGTATRATTSIPAANLSAGSYFLLAGGLQQGLKLEKL
jgi:aminopeptidase N